MGVTIHEDDGISRRGSWTRTQPTSDVERFDSQDLLADDWDDAHSVDETRFVLLDEAEGDSLDEDAPWNVFGEPDERVEGSVDSYLLSKAMDDFIGLVAFTVVFCATLNGIRFLPDADRR